MPTKKRTRTQKINLDLRARIEELEEAAKHTSTLLRMRTGERDQLQQLHVQLARKVATYSAGLEPLDVLVSLSLNQVGPEDSFSRSVLLALGQGIEELRRVNDPAPVNGCSLEQAS